MNSSKLMNQPLASGVTYTLLDAESGYGNKTGMAKNLGEL
jgi:hypothetical protein